MGYPGEPRPGNYAAAIDLVREQGIPIGVLYRAHESKPMHQRLAEARERTKLRVRSIDQQLDGVQV